MNPNDKIREAILRHLYDVHQKARGPRGVAVGIRDLHSAMKNLEIKHPEVNSNLDYLIQKGWAVRVVEDRKFTTARGTTQQSEKVTYKISDVGIDKLEAASAYRREDTFSRINVTNIRGVTVIGSGNIVNAEMTELAGVLSEIERKLAVTERIDEEQRLNALADIATIQSQLAKPKPSVGIIKQVWCGIEAIVTAADFGELVAQATAMIASLG